MSDRKKQEYTEAYKYWNNTEYFLLVSSKQEPRGQFMSGFAHRYG